MLLKIKFEPRPYPDLISADVIEVAKVEMCLTRRPIHSHVTVTALAPEPDNGARECSERVSHRSFIGRNAETSPQLLHGSLGVAFPFFNAHALDAGLFSLLRD